MHQLELVEKVKLLLAQGDLNEAIQLLLRYVNRKEEINTIINQSGRYRDLMDMVAQGIISHNDYLRDLNTLRWSILKLLDSLEETDIQNSNATSASIKEMKGTYLLSLARIRVLKLLRESEQGLTITELHTGSGMMQRKYVVSSLEELKQLGIVDRYRLNDRALNKLSQIGRVFVADLMIDVE